MRIGSIFLVAILGIARSSAERNTKAYKRHDHYEDHQEAVVHIDPDQYHHYEHDTGFSSGSGLRSIAQGSANQAHTAVASQYVAAQQAAYIAQSTLAQEAIQAAATAHAALAGKEVLFHGLEKQVEDAHYTLESEIKHFELAKNAALAAKQAAEAASQHVSVLTAALNNANIAAEHAKLAADQAAAELASQTSMVGKAKERLTSTMSTLHAAQIDYDATREAANKASAAAQEAQENASNAGAFTTHNLQEVALTNAAEAHLNSAANTHLTFDAQQPTVYHQHHHRHH